MYGLTWVVGMRGGPCSGSTRSGVESTVSISAATAWPVHDWPSWSSTTWPALASRALGRSWSFGRYWRPSASNGSGRAFVRIVLPSISIVAGLLVFATAASSRWRAGRPGGAARPIPRVVVGRRAGVAGLRVEHNSPMGSRRALGAIVALALVAGCGGGRGQRARPSPPAPSAHGSPFAGEPRAVIVDTDMAADDWLAILYLVGRPEVDVVAITVTGGGEA